MLLLLGLGLVTFIGFVFTLVYVVGSIVDARARRLGGWQRK